MSDDANGPDGSDPTPPASLLPYEAWLEDAHRNVMLRALEHVSEHGLPGDHHFYMTFLTSAPGVDIPARLRERYPEDMTIVLQHQFQNLTMDRSSRTLSVGLSFNGIPSTLRIPFGAITAFADPHVHLAFRFSPALAEPQGGGEDDGVTAPAAPAEVLDFHGPADGTSAEDDPARADTPPESAGQEGAEVVSLAAFRKKPSGHSGEPPDGKDS